MININALFYKRGSFEVNIPTLSIEKGEKVAVIGENGSGKSTLLHVLTGLIPTNGVQFNGCELNELERKKRAQLIAFMPQMPSVVFPFSVFEVVRLGAYASGHRNDADRLTYEVLERISLATLSNRSFSELSGGEKRRVMIARALNQRTDALFLDEPVSMLDVRHSLEILELLEKSSQTVVASMHEVNLSVRYFDRVLMMKNGKLIYDVPANKADVEMLSEVYDVKADNASGYFTFGI